MITKSTGIISTFVGNGLGSAFVSEQLKSPTGIAVGVSEDIYFLDNARVQMVTKSTGTITTFAGNGVAGYSGDNIPATSAQLYSPSGVAVSATGDVYISEVNFPRIRMVTKNTGIITTFAGTSIPGYSGDNGPASSGRISGPRSIAFGVSGDLFIVDTGNFRIRIVSKITDIIKTVAGNGYLGDRRYSGPALSGGIGFNSGIDLDTLGNIYMAGYNGISMVKKSIGVTVNLFTALGQGVALDRSGSMYITTIFQRVVRLTVVTATLTAAPTGNFD